MPFEWISAEPFVPHIITLVLRSEIDGEVFFDEQEAILLAHGIVVYDADGELYVQNCTLESADKDDERWLIDLDDDTYRELLKIESDTLYDRVAQSPELARALAKLAQAEMVVKA